MVAAPQDGPRARSIAAEELVGRPAPALVSSFGGEPRAGAWPTVTTLPVLRPSTVTHRRHERVQALEMAGRTRIMSGQLVR